MAATPSTENAAAPCPLCGGVGGVRAWGDERLRVVLPAEPDYPGFTRVVWNEHVGEMSSLAPADRERLMAVVWEVELAQREALEPDKVNLASFGNLVPHLHWHVVPRWRDDRHFPEPVWGRPATGRDRAIAARVALVRARLPVYRALLEERLGRR
jgi:diadenosine tetraphosphate (Ap4A) HIT family hydrolase